MLSIRPRLSKSWLDTRAARGLSASLASRLVERCRGEKGLFLTLTYRRQCWDSPRDLYRASSTDRHVRRFMERLSHMLDESLKGRWLCKLEFQQGGWVHWHIVLLGTGWIDHKVLDHAWGWGFVHVRRLSRARIHYAAKYVAKGDELPAFLLAEPCRSVKIIRVSPGFWGESDRPPRDPPAYTFQRISAWVPIGELIARAETESVVRDEKTGRYCRVNMNWGDLVTLLLANGARFVSFERGWVCLRCIPTRLRPPEAPRGGPAGRAGRILHLIRTRNPPATEPGSSWLWRYFSEAA